jgi:hypothetical protein
MLLTRLHAKSTRGTRRPLLALLGVTWLAAAPAAVHAQTWTPGSGGSVSYTAGRVGIGTPSPGTNLHVLQGTGGTMAFPYESAVFQRNGDLKLGVYTTQVSFAGAGAAITFGDSRATNSSGRFPGFEIQNINGNTPGASYLRFNYIERNSAGMVAGATPSILYITGVGNVGIGTTNPQHKLSVNGTVGAREIIVTNTGWADHVLRPDYRLMPLPDLANYIESHGRLPGIPSEAQVRRSGVGLAETQVQLLAKIEELTLYMIQEHARIEALERDNLALRGDIRRLKDSR